MHRKVVPYAILILIFFLNSWTFAEREQRKKFADELHSEIASTWFELLYDVVKAEQIAPPEASRVYGITAVALYESIVAGTKEHRSLVGQLNELMSVPKPETKKEHHWLTVANAAIAHTIRGLYPTISPTSMDTLNKLEEKFALLYQARVPKHEYERSATHGQDVATAILAWAATDALSIYDNCPYTAVPVAGAWEPTPPLFNSNPLQPCWGLIRPMVLTSGEECAPRGHPRFSAAPSSDFFAAAFEVYSVVKELTAEQKRIADYWSDAAGATGTPPGHWIAIVSQLARNDGLSLAEAAEAYARVGIAVHDAFIGCWNTKYVYNLQRPVTYINDNIDGGWMPYIVTPNFPSYTSGHSTQSGAAASVLTDMFGVKKFRDTTHIDHGLVPLQKPRTFESFREAAAEAAVSRLYGGIHFRFDNDDGLASGQCI
jgi:PAP2 superfamily